MSRLSRLLLILLPLPLAGCGSGLSVSVELPKEVIQKKVSERFPLEVAEEKGDSPLRLTLSDPVVLLEDGKDQVGLRVNLVAKVGPGGQLPLPIPKPETRLTGSATVFASVSYDPKKKAITLSDP